ncbi:MAG: hypothetical protein HY903_04835 [Deltaproteobacteria bacterium]|nr:hypothetical protein [Deltaproteobacteria bacterium]
MIAILAACVSMLVTSGIVAFATAAPVAFEPSSTMSDDDLDRYVSAYIDEQYRKLVAASRE